MQVADQHDATVYSVHSQHLQLYSLCTCKSVTELVMHSAYALRILL